MYRHELCHQLLTVLWIIYIQEIDSKWLIRKVKFEMVMVSQLFTLLERIYLFLQWITSTMIDCFWHWIWIKRRIMCANGSNKMHSSSLFLCVISMDPHWSGVSSIRNNLIWILCTLSLTKLHNISCLYVLFMFDCLFICILFHSWWVFFFTVFVFKSFIEFDPFGAVDTMSQATINFKAFAYRSLS